MPASCRVLVIACFNVIITVVTACSSCNNNGSTLTGGAAPVLLFNGTGTSVNDVTATEAILDYNNLHYITVNSSELNRMSRSEFMRHRLLFVPGGNFIVMGKNIDTGTAVNIRYAVQHGLNYIGICAGAFLAGNSAYYNGFNLTNGVTFSFYAAENKGIRKAAIAITSPGVPPLDQYWEDGPQLSGWGAIVAKYPDGTPAVAEGKCGIGHVILTGIHAEAPEGWRRGMVFNTSVSIDNAYAATLIRAALNGESIAHY